MRATAGSILVALRAGMAHAARAIGIYGMLGYLVLRRTREIGIRLAIAAQPAHIAVDVVRAAVVPVSVGLCIGCLVSIAAARWADSLLFGVSAHDPIAMAIGIAVLLAIAVAAAAMPAKRAAQTDPLRALRVE